MQTKKCVICDSEFTTKYRSVTCSDKCRKEYYLRDARKRRGENESGERPCIWCGQYFVPYIRGKKGSEHRVACSEKCEKEQRKKINRYSKRKTNYGNIGSVEVTDATFYQAYKEPLKPVVGGHGYYGTLLYSKEHDLIQCHECGEWFRALYGGCKGHLSTHGLTADSYKEKYKLARKTALISEGLREKLVKHYLELAKDPEFLKTAKNNMLSEKAAYNRRHSMSGKKIRLETRNKRGNCPDQLLEKIRIVGDYVKRENNLVSQSDYIKVFGYGDIQTIFNTFGSWKKACKLAGYKSARWAKKFTDEQLIKFLQNFYDEHKRTPISSDFSRGYLPSKNIYRARFGSLNEARHEAGIPQIKLVGRGHWMETKNIVKQMDKDDLIWKNY